jgi:hypothetical protein
MWILKKRNILKLSCSQSNHLTIPAKEIINYGCVFCNESVKVVSLTFWKLTSTINSN